MDRVCKKCNIRKNVEDFSTNRGRRTLVCKKCESERVMEYQKDHKEQVSEAKLKWRAQNKEKEFLETKATRLAVKYLKQACPEIYRECIDRARAEVGLKPSRKAASKNLLVHDNQHPLQLEHQPL